MGRDLQIIFEDGLTLVSQQQHQNSTETLTFLLGVSVPTQSQLIGPGH